MTDFTSHKEECCILSRSDAFIIATLIDEKITYLSPGALNILKLLPNSENPTQLSLLFSSTDIFQEEGLIQPTECISGKEGFFIYSCSHNYSDKRGVYTKIYLYDATEMKSEFNSISRNPIGLGVKKMVSSALPDFISDSEYEIGQGLTLKLDQKGLIIELFPFTHSFLGINRTELYLHPIMQFVHQGDLLLLSQALSECYKNGVVHFIIRWSNPSPNDTLPASVSKWIQAKALLTAKDADSKHVLLTLTNLTPTVIVEDNKWSLLKSYVTKQIPSYNWTQQIPSYSWTSVFKPNFEVDKKTEM